MSLHYLSKFLDRRFLQHALEHIGSLTPAHEYAVILCKRRVYPHSVADNISLGNWLQALCRAHIHIAARYERVIAVGRNVHHLFVERKLERQQILPQTLSFSPAEHRNRRKNLSAWSIGRQSAALSAGMKKKTLVLSQPRVEIISSAPLFETFIEKPRCTAS